MLFQLGNKTFDGLFAPESWSYSGSEANLAEYALINTKPRLQPTGETLEELTITLQLRAEYCNPDREIKELESWKSNSEILPLLLGNGDYRNDYVIKSISKDILQTFSDGTIIEANITINLLECVPASNEAQQAAADRRNASAVGNKEQIGRRAAQKKTPEAEAHRALMDAQIKAWEAAEQAAPAPGEESTTGFMDKVKNKVQRAQDAMEDARQKIADTQATITNGTGIIGAINNAESKLTEIVSLLNPPLSLQNLNDSVLNLQTGLRGLSTAAAGFTNDVILRRV